MNISNRKSIFRVLGIILAWISQWTLFVSIWRSSFLVVESLDWFEARRNNWAVQVGILKQFEVKWVLYGDRSRHFFHLLGLIFILLLTVFPLHILFNLLENVLLIYNLVLSGLLTDLQSFIMYLLLMLLILLLNILWIIKRMTPWVSRYIFEVVREILVLFLLWMEPIYNIICRIGPIFDLFELIFWIH